MTDAEQLTFPRQHARTQRLTLGTPRAFTPAPDGSRIALLRTRTGSDSATCLWTADPVTGALTLIADPVELLAGSGAEELTEAEKARRERSRQGAAGIVDYSADDAVAGAAFALSGRLFAADLAEGGVRELPAQGPVVDPRIDPSGRRVAYLSGGSLRLIGVDGTGDRALAEPDGPEPGNVAYGAADFIAAEEFHRYRGHWWSPDGGSLLVARVDESPVPVLYISDPANPESAPRAVRYPAAGAPNAIVELYLIGLDGSRRKVEWDRAGYEYVAGVSWNGHGPALVAVLNRDQRTGLVLAVAADGSTSVAAEEHDPVWVEFFPGAPVWAPPSGQGGPARLARIAPRGESYRLLLDEQAVTPEGVQVRTLLAAGPEYGFVTASMDDPTRVHVLRVAWADGAMKRLNAYSGVSSAAIGGNLAVVTTARLEEPNSRSAVAEVLGEQPKRLAMIESVAERPVLTTRPIELALGERELRAVLLLPANHKAGTKLPVLLDPYAGPGAQRVLGYQNIHLTSQWLADQGFAVLVVDGRGTPGRGPVWERSIRDDFAGATLDDQIDALHAAAEQYPDLDLGRVAIRGWSYGGYLAALAVLKRPDVFHAAVVGAPVTDWRLYDTAYTELYLGHPGEQPEVYNANSLFPEAGEGAWQWAEPHRPMLLIHGLADDNVVMAHTLRLSSALLAAGRAHQVLPLSGVTHMTPQEVVAENMLNLQMKFLKDALGL
ncbi:prolyl oligopeptidase family serine peptidase [Actinospica sp.]|jgi:dipeptidyl-peptidase-4|uniref:prolyl oligopeptidase family serine peptidase n=1 Tax=Actinospica sp. TaxID=1872142 RepID=UPI002BB8DBE5|nr:prolyl oligopeptidase family serine peptidase [Actinospica sp.]HWG25408.1 prolyl oligopeptidase family serine peptidase [Actinospica sp.]